MTQRLNMAVLSGSEVRASLREFYEIQLSVFMAAGKWTCEDVVGSKINSILWNVTLLAVHSEACQLLQLHMQFLFLWSKDDRVLCSFDVKCSSSFHFQNWADCRGLETHENDAQSEK